MSLPPPARMGKEGAARAPCPLHQGAFPALLEDGALGLGLAQLPGGLWAQPPTAPGQLPPSSFPVCGTSSLPYKQNPICSPVLCCHQLSVSLLFSPSPQPLPAGPGDRQGVGGCPSLAQLPWVSQGPLPTFSGGLGLPPSPSPVPWGAAGAQGTPGWALSSPGDAQPKPQPLLPPPVLPGMLLSPEELLACPSSPTPELLAQHWCTNTQEHLIINGNAHRDPRIFNYQRHQSQTAAPGSPLPTQQIHLGFTELPLLSLSVFFSSPPLLPIIPGKLHQ